MNGPVSLRLQVCDIAFQCVLCVDVHMLHIVPVKEMMMKLIVD